MKNIPSTFLGLLRVTTLCGVATQCSSLEKVENPGYGSIVPLYVPIAIIFPKPSNVWKTQGGHRRSGILLINSNFIHDESLLIAVAVCKKA